MNIHTSSSSRRTFVLRAAAASLLPTFSFAQAPAWPTRPVKIVVAAGPGSSLDATVRLYAPRLAEIWKQPIVIENKPAAGGIVATESALAANDGQTLLFHTQSALLPKYTTRNLRFDPVTDLTPVYRVIDNTIFFLTNAQTAQRVKTLAGLVELSKSTPQGIFVGGTGRTALLGASMGLLSKAMGLRFTSIDYNGIGPLTISLIRDDTQLALSSLVSVKGQVDSKELVPLAVVDSKRFAYLPDVPTLGEAVGYKGFLPVPWGGIFVPKSTPQEVVGVIARAFDALHADEPIRKSWETRLSAKLVKSSPSQFAREYAEEARLWKDTFAMLGIVPE